MKKFALLAFGVVAMLFVLVGCGTDDAVGLDSINVTYVESPLNVPSIIERERGLFADILDVEVNYSDLTAGPDQTAALASGDIDFLFAVGATSVIQAAAGGLDIKIISTYSRAPEAFMMFSEDVELDSPEDLRGLTVAGPAGTILHEMLIAYLETAGMTENDINFVQMGIPESYAALESGAADLALLAGPMAFNAMQSGLNVVTNGVGLVEATIVVATSGAFYDENPEWVESFIEAHNEILKFMANNHEESMEITSEVIGLDIEAVEGMFPMYDFNSEILDSDITAMEQTMQFMYANDMIDTQVDISSIILNR